MAQVSKYPISEQVYQQIFDLLLRVFTQSQSKDEATNLLDDLLSPTEKIVLSKRLAIALLLTKKYTYEQIGKVLRVSKPTIALVNLSLKHGTNGYKQFTQKILGEEKIRETWERIEDMVLSTMQKGKGSGPWRYLRQELHRKKYKRAF
ncbi:hypothetical protein HZB97_02480 [Candidatus Gottesmanbacteria bacterium]|nr:hypothetical protein [Candidatus Gottesmanbacteria bacterium]MBI5465004.1 hypothetical protein [Candidatus Gottesmanbacteria bacterium]